MKSVAAALFAVLLPASLAADTPSLQLPYTQFTLAQRTARDSPRRPQRAGGERERLVPRRLGKGTHGSNRICSSLRTFDVHGIRPRQAGRVRFVARRRRRSEQRIDRIRPHELLDQRAVECARARAVSRIRPDGISPRLDDAADRRRTARRREERATPER